MGVTGERRGRQDQVAREASGEGQGAERRRYRLKEETPGRRRGDGAPVTEGERR